MEEIGRIAFMALPIEPTKTVTGKQAAKHLEMIDKGKAKKKYKISLKTPKKTLAAVQSYLSKNNP